MDEQNLELSDGQWYRLSDNASIERMRFDDIQLSLPAAADVGIPVRGKPLAALQWDAPAERAELVWRLALPLAVLILSLLALLLARQSSGKWRDYILAIFVFFLYLNLLRYVKAEMAADTLPVLLGVLLPPLAMGLVVSGVFRLTGGFR